MFKRIVSVVLIVVATIAIDNRFFEQGHVPVSPITNDKHLAGTVVAFYSNEYQKYAIDLLTERGKLEQWSCLYTLWMNESNWRPTAVNKKSGAYGIAQFMPATWKSVGFKRTNDGFIQVEAGLAYIDRRYSGNACRALGSNLSRGWY